MRSMLPAVVFGLLGASALWADEAKLRTADRPATACHGTAVNFVANPVEAAKLAAKKRKLVAVLHVSGYFETPDFT